MILNQKLKRVYVTAFEPIQTHVTLGHSKCRERFKKATHTTRAGIIGGSDGANSATVPTYNVISLFHCTAIITLYTVHKEIIKTEHWGYVLLYDRYGSTNQANSASSASCWRRGSVVRTSVCSWRTFPDLRLIHGWRVTTSWVRRPLWVNQLGQLSLPSLRGR